MKRNSIVLRCIIGIGLLLTAGTAFANDYTETYSCDTCDYQDAVNLAETLHEAPRCVASGLDGGLLSLGSTTFSCETTEKEIIIANPLSRAAFKFKIKTEQRSTYSNAYDVVVTDVSFENFESTAMNVFYDIDADFRSAVKERMSQPLPQFISGLQQANETFSAETSDESCDSHPLNFLVDGDFRADLKKQMTTDIQNKIGYRESWAEFSSETSLGGGLTISTGGNIGVSINMSRNSVDVFSIQQFGNPDNVLSFTVTYAGEYFGDTYGWQASSGILPIPQYGPNRNLRLNFSLNAGASIIEGYPANDIYGRNTFEDGAISACFKEIAKKNADSIKVTPIGSGGGGTIGGGGTTGGGGISTQPGTYVNLAGCHIVEITSTTVWEDGSTGVSVMYYREC